MTYARPSHLRLVASEPKPVPARQPRLRFRPVVSLSDGSPFGLDAEADIAFEDTERPGRTCPHEPVSAATWLGDLIERACRLARGAETSERPMSILAPMAALSDQDAPLAAEAAVQRAGALAQEIRIDFCDASVFGLEDLAMDRIDAFRRRGFRTGLDARRSWRTPMGARARMTFEAVRIDLTRLAGDEIPVSRMAVASAGGVALIAHQALWREAEALAELGVAYAVCPRADS